MSMPFVTYDEGVGWGTITLPADASHECFLKYDKYDLGHSVY